MRTVAEMFTEMKKIADEEGYQFNPGQEELNDLLKGLWENEHRYGYLSCPCRMASGAIADDMDIICPCNYRDADIEEYGCCLCTLYVNDDWISGKKKHDPIPERRPQEYYEKGYPSIMEQKGAGEMAEIYRCNVCGYLCARDEPPDLCPICRAKKERFEKFGLKG